MQGEAMNYYPLSLRSPEDDATFGEALGFRV